MKIKTGTDVEEIERFRAKPVQKNKSFYLSVFTKSELSHCLKYSDPYPHLAGVFSAKEAVIKCLVRPVSRKKIEVSWRSNGKPEVSIGQHKLDNLDISISHTSSIALAVAVILA